MFYSVFTHAHSAPLIGAHAHISFLSGGKIVQSVKQCIVERMEERIKAQVKDSDPAEVGPRVRGLS